LRNIGFSRWLCKSLPLVFSSLNVLTGFPEGLPPLPALPSLPGNARWSAMIAQAHLLLSEAVAEMQNYPDNRFEQWQDSTKTEELLAKLEHLQETMDQLQGIE
jgi:hypothetical protein